MSERQAKKSRKNIGEAREVKKQKDKASIIVNVIATILVVAVLGLGVYAIAPKYIAEYQANKEAQPKTVSDFLSEKDITMEEFRAEYGIGEETEVKKDDEIDSLALNFTLENYAKYQGMTADELKAKYELGDADVTMAWKDAMLLVKTGNVAKEMGFADFETFKTQVQLPDTVTENTPWGETIDIMNAMTEAQNVLNETNAEATQTEGE